MPSQITDFLATQADGGGDYDWSESANWSNGVPQNGDEAIVDAANTTGLDNIAGLTLIELNLENGGILVGAASLTINTLDINPGANGPVSLTALSGASIYVDALAETGANGQIVAEAGSQIEFVATSTLAMIDVPIEIDGSSGSLAGGAVTIQSGYAAEGDITLATAGAQLNLDNLAAAPIVSGSGGTVSLNAASVYLAGGGNTINLSGADDAANLSGTNGNWDTVKGSGGKIKLTSAQASIVGDDDIINASAGSSVSIYGDTIGGIRINGSSDQVILNDTFALITGGNNVITATPGSIADLQIADDAWDTVYGSNVNLELTYAQPTQFYSVNASIIGGDDTIQFGNALATTLSLYNTDGHADLIYSVGTLILNNAQAKVFAAGVVYEYGTSNVDFDGANGWATVYASGGQVTVDSTQDRAQVSIVGSANTIQGLGRETTLSLYATDDNWDTVTGSDQQIYLNSAQASITGGDDAVATKGDCSMSLYGADGVADTVVGSQDQIILNSASSAVSGNDDIIYEQGASSAQVSGEGDVIVERGTSSAQVNGGDNSIYQYGASTVNIALTSNQWDTVYGSGEQETLSSAAASILGGGNAISLTGISSTSLYDTNGVADAVTGADDLLILSNAQASLTGSDDVIDFVATSALSVIGDSESFRFGSALGLSSITGFNSSDVLDLNTADWSSFSALQSSGDLTQSGPNAEIRLDASDTITLVNVQASTLTASQFSFSSQSYG